MLKWQCSSGSAQVAVLKWQCSSGSAPVPGPVPGPVPVLQCQRRQLHSWASSVAIRLRKATQARNSPSNPEPARSCSRSEPKESRTRGGCPYGNPSTAVRLRHLAGVYCLDSRDHRPFVLEFPVSTGQPVPASSRAFQFRRVRSRDPHTNHFQISCV